MYPGRSRSVVTATDRDGKRTFALTDAGRAEAEARIAGEGYPWEGHGPRRRPRRAAHRRARPAPAARQVGLTGSPEVVERATEIVTTARTEPYRLLADS